jgi:hypothetical protein
MIWSVLVFGLVLGFVLAQPSHAAANTNVPPGANGYGCGVMNPTYGRDGDQQAAGLVVNVKWQKYGESNKREDTTSRVQITTKGYSYKPPHTGGIAQMSPDDSTELSLNEQKTFDQVPANCTGMGDNTGVVLGYGKTSPDDGGWYHWALDCEETDRAAAGLGNTNPDNRFQPFDVTGVGVPAGAKSGGTWSIETVQPVNGTTAYVTVVYNEPPSIPNDTCPGDTTFENPKESNFVSSGLPASGGFDTTGAAGPYNTEGHKYEWKSPKLYHISDVKEEQPPVYPYMQATTWTGKDTPNNQDNPFNIWYNNYINQYPFDSHHVVVTYKAFYDDHLWKATGNYHDGGTPRYNGDDTWDWEPYGVTTGEVDNLSKTAQDWGECYDRGFEVHDKDNGLNTNVQMGNTYENPTHASFGFAIPVSFFLPDVIGNDPPRNPMKVCGLTYGANYYIKNAGGANIGPLPGHGSDSGGVGNNPDGCLYSPGGATGTTSVNFNTGPYNFAAGTLHAGDEICVDFSVSPGGDRMNQDGTITHATGGVSNSACSAPVVNEPYFKVYNSSVSAGGDFGACGSTGGLLESWNDNTGADRGASAQLSALALIKITGVASAQTAAGRSPTDLSFANTAGAPLSTDGQSPDLGGAFGGTSCLTNVPMPANAQPETVNNPTVGSSPLDDGSHSYSTGNVTLNSGSIANSKNVGVYINGRDVYIKNSGNNGIKYSGAGGSWTINNTGTDVPSFTLVATGGNIYIDPSITELDGLYVAQKDGAGHGGTIYTCGSASGSSFSPMPASSLYGSCNQQLTIYGSFVANQVNLMRTYGSLRDAQAGEGLPSPGTPPTGGTTGASAQLDWSHDGHVGGDTGCEKIDEPSEPGGNGWDNNFLCIPDDAGTSVDIGWTHDGQVDHLHSEGLSHCTASWGSVVHASGYDLAHHYDWDNDYLCSNVPVSFRTSVDPTRFCTLVNEPSAHDDHGHPWPTVFVCFQKAIPGSPGTLSGPPAIIGCNNSGAQPSNYTCAGEVFRFSPELYLTNQAISPPSNGALIEESRTSLPPVL